EPFFTTKPAGKGTGLGLAQVFGAARQSGGQVEIDSAPERGTTVRLLLPRTEAARAPADVDAAPAPPAPRGNGRKALVVDDEAGVRSFVAQTLRDAGFDAAEAGDPGAALRKLDADRFDLLITDFSMPAMTGLELAEQARKRQPNMQLLIISGWADAEALE